MNILEKISLPTQLNSGRSLDDPELLEEPVDMGIDKEFNLADSVNISAATNLRVSLFNSILKKDRANVISSEDEELKPLITYDPLVNSYLKYGVSASIDAGFIRNGSGIGGSIDGSIEAFLAYYSLHSSGDRIKDAVLKDLKTFKTIINWKSVQKIKKGDALQLSMRGELNGSIEVSWSNVLNRTINEVLRNLGTKVPVSISLSPSFSGKFSFSITDAFSYSILRQSNELAHIRVSKQSNRQTGIDAALSIGVNFSEPEVVSNQISTLLDRVVKSLTNGVDETIIKKIAKVKDKGESIVNHPVLKKLAEAFGFDLEKVTIDELEIRYKIFYSKLKERITNLSLLQVQSTLQFQYRKIKEGEEILECRIPLKQLKKYHPKLLRFNMSDLVSDIAAYKIPGLELISYLKEDSIRIEKSIGFSLTILGNKILESDSWSRNKVVVNKNIANHLKISHHNIAGYNGALGRTKVNWWFEQNANMAKFSINEHPSLDEFQYYWSIGFRNQRRVNRSWHLQSLMDNPCLFGALSEPQKNNLIDRHYKKVRRKDVRVETEILVSENELISVLKKIAEDFESNEGGRLLPISLAAALPYHNTDIRRSVSKREQVYSNLWKYYLQKPDPNLSWNHITEDYLFDRIGLSNVPALERSRVTNDYSFSGQLRSYGNIKDHISNGLNGIACLHNGIKNKDRADSIYNDAINKVQIFRRESLYIRTLARMVVLNSGLPERQSDQVKVTFGISIEKDGEWQDLLIRLDG